MDQKELRAKLLSIMTTTKPVRFDGSPDGLDIFYKRPSIAQRDKWLESFIGPEGKPMISKMGKAQAIAVSESACTADGALLFERANIAELEAADANSWVAALGKLLIREASGGTDAGKTSDETASAS